MADHKTLWLVFRGKQAYEEKYLPENKDKDFGSDCSMGCKHFHPLEGKEGYDWGVCCNPVSKFAGELVFEHITGCGGFEWDPSLDEDIQ